MKKTLNIMLAIVCAAGLLAGCATRTGETLDTRIGKLTTEQVTAANFVHAETANYFSKHQRENVINTFAHGREAVTKENQVIIRSNADLLYSRALVDT